MSGLDFLGAIRDGALAPAPIAQHFNFAIEEVEYGRVVFTCDVDESADNPIGLVHGGLICTFADTVIGCAVHSTLGPEFAYNSIDISVSYLGAVTRDSGPLRAVGVVTRPGRRVAFATAEIFDADAKLVATAMGSCLVMRQGLQGDDQPRR